MGNYSYVTVNVLYMYLACTIFGLLFSMDLIWFGLFKPLKIYICVAMYLIWRRYNCQRR